MASLTATCESAIITGFKDTLTTGKFTCGGTIATTADVQLNYLRNDGQWNGVTFPGLHIAEFQHLIESSIVASFGKGKENVTDKSYRDAYALDPKRFTTSFHVSSSDVLGEIRSLLAPDAFSIRAELYKLNIYTGPTGCFKSHVDTPRGCGMFGSLVVCLPSQFVGGNLLARNNGQEVIYDWSSSADNPPKDIRWAAFYSDVEHEILQVTEGYRVTLTYNLYHCHSVQFSPTVDPTTSPFYNHLKAAIGHPHFLREGGTLGFICQHAYILDEFDKGKPISLLKGSDRTIFFAAESLGLGVGVKAIINTNDHDLSGSSIMTTDLDGPYIKSSFKFEDCACIGYDYETWNDFCDAESHMSTASDIIWCQTTALQTQPALAAMHYGNDYTLDILYQAAVILISIPDWSKRQQI